MHAAPGLCLLLLLAAPIGACGSASGPAPAPPAARATSVTGDASCAADVGQNLTFSGDLAGHLACPAGAHATCAQYRGATTAGLAVTIGLHAGPSEAQLFITPGVNYTGTPARYTTEKAVKEEGNSVGLDGAGHWISTPGGTFAVTADDARVVRGTVDVTLEGPGTAKAHVTGSWSCVWVGRD